MSYLEAFQIGWSILWRKCAWMAAAGALELGLYFYGHSRALAAGAAIASGPVLMFYVFPRIIQGLTSIEYTDFRIVLTRPEGGKPELTYLESLALLFSIYLANAFLAIPLRLLLAATYQYFVLAFYPIVVAMPAAAYILVNFPTKRFQLEVVRTGYLYPGVPLSSV